MASHGARSGTGRAVSGRRRARPILALAIAAGALGIVVAMTPWTLDHPGRRWLWRWAQPGWPIGVGVLWLLCAMGATLLAKRPRLAVTLLLAAAVSQPTATLLASGCDDIGCGYGWWHANATTIAFLDAAAAILSFGGGWILGRASEVPPVRWVWNVLGVVSTLAAIALFGFAWLAGSVLLGDDPNPAAASGSLLSCVILSGIAGTFLGWGTRSNRRERRRPSPTEQVHRP